MNRKQTMKVDEIVQLIRQKQTFEAIASDGSFHIKINRYVPYCCMAIHDGSNLRSELKEKIAIDEFGRWQEEDPHTGKFISSLPITIIGLDSRFEYDLNRSPEECIYEEAWGKKVWKKNLSVKDQQISRKKHENFYRVIAALIQQLNGLFGASVVYDIHSYNHLRWGRAVPLFNLGTEKIDQQKFGDCIRNWEKELSLIKLKGIENQTAINDVFAGRGYNLHFITSRFPDTLVFATEIKKVYCHELTGEEYPRIIREIQQQLKKAILNNALYFSNQYTNLHHKSKTRLLDQKTDPGIEKVDKGLFKLLKNFEILAYVNPVNTRAEYHRFIRNRHYQLPQFRYSPLKINPFELKQSISALKTNKITDVSIRYLYESVINSFFDKIDLMASLNTKTFLYNSLRYFGRPGKKDLQYAKYLLHLPPIPYEPKRMPYLNKEEVYQAFADGIKHYNIRCNIEFSQKVIAKALVLNTKKTVLINPNARFTEKEIRALVEHEIGVHMVTTQNSSLQKLKVFHLGLPVNTLTQEGLAVMSEYLSGNISLGRLKKLALRVMVTDMMCNGADFIECYHFLTEQQAQSSHEAFTMVTRIFRGGGFTKDFLYLKGFVKILHLWQEDKNLLPLLVGKTSYAFYDVIEEMIERKLVDPPTYHTKSIIHPDINYENPVYEYIISGLNQYK